MTNFELELQFQCSTEKYRNIEKTSASYNIRFLTIPYYYGKFVIYGKKMIVFLVRNIQRLQTIFVTYLSQSQRSQTFP